MTYKSLQSYYTHLGVSGQDSSGPTSAVDNETQNAARLQLDIDLTHSSKKELTLKCVCTKQATGTLEVKYEDLTMPLKVSSKGKVSDRLPLSNKVQLREYSVLYTSALQPQVRTLTYASGAVSQFSLQQQLEDEETLYIYRLPNAVGKVVLKDQQNTLVEAALVPSNRGYFASPYLDSSMLSTNPETIAWGVLKAIQENDKSLIIATLKEFIHHAKTRNWIIKDPEYKVSPDPVWGLEQNFFPLKQQDINPYQEKEVGPNAFLGFAITLAIRSLQDVYPVGSIKLYGSWTDFQVELTTALKALATYCTYSISPISGWCAYKSEGGYYTYDAPSLKASYLTDLFLGQYLELFYDFDLHKRAVLLHDALENSPENPLDDYYKEFVDRDYAANELGTEPTNISTNTAFAIRYRDCTNVAFNLLWSLQYRRYLVPSLLVLYEQVRGPFQPETIEQPFTKTDFIAVWVKRIIGQELTKTWENTVYTNNEAKGLPNKGDSFDSLVLNELAIAAFDPFAFSPFDFQDKALNALVTKGVQEMRRLWPYGYKWTREEYENDTKTAIGSLLFAEADTFRTSYLGYLLLKGNVNPGTASGEALRKWLGLIAPLKLLSSDSFLRTWLINCLATTGDLATTIRQVLGYRNAEAYFTDPEPFGLLTQSTNDGTFSSYSSNVHTFDRQNTDKAIYANFAYKPSNGFNVSDTSYKCSSTVPLNKNLGLQQRKVAGFPRRDYRVSITDIRCSSTHYVNNSGSPGTRPRILRKDYDYRQPNVYVIDEQVVIEPIANYLPVINVRLNAPTVPGIKTLLQKTQPAGVKINLEGLRVIS